MWNYNNIINNFFHYDERQDDLSYNIRLLHELMKLKEEAEIKHFPNNKQDFQTQYSNQQELLNIHSQIEQLRAYCIKLIKYDIRVKLGDIGNYDVTDMYLLTRKKNE